MTVVEDCYGCGEHEPTDAEERDEWQLRGPDNVGFTLCPECMDLPNDELIALHVGRMKVA